MENPPGRSLNEKVAVIIGGTGGIGAALADGLAAAGATVVPTSRNATRVQRAVQRLEDSTGLSIPAVTVDSVVAMGKVFLAAAEKRPIPEGWAVDANGDPVTDPSIEGQSRSALRQAQGGTGSV
jgi:NAD(P)-dependent dehydrogenase (short-subunit alcohol dehydrogenase family)